MTQYPSSLIVPDLPTTPPDEPAGCSDDCCDECRVPVSRCPGPEPYTPEWLGWRDYLLLVYPK